MSVGKQVRHFACALMAGVTIFIHAASAKAAILNDPGCTTNVLQRNDDNYTGAVPLGFDFYFGGQFYSSTNISNNGYVIFGSQAPVWFLLHSWTLFNVPLISPYHVDIDTRAPVVDPPRPPRSSEVTYGPITYNVLVGGNSVPRPAFCVNWVNVGYFSMEDDKLNSFQLIIVGRSDRGIGDVDVHMNFEKLEWDTADGSSATLAPRVGIYDGTSIITELPGSNLHGTLVDSNPGGLTHQSVGSLVPGQYVYPLQGGLPPTTAVITGDVLDTNGVLMTSAPIQACPSCLGSMISDCVTGTTNSQGRYTLASSNFSQCVGTWHVTVSPPAGSQALMNMLDVLFTATDQIIADANVTLSYPLQVPSGTTIVPSRGGLGSPPVVYWGDPLTLTTFVCGPVVGAPTPPMVTYKITQAGSTVPLRSGPMVDTPPAPNPPDGRARYVATLPPLNSPPTPIHGLVTVTFNATCAHSPGDPPPQSSESSFNMYIDPSGVVHTTRGAALEGAQVTLLRSETALGPFEPVPDGSAIMSPKNRNNPDYTDSSGRFGWDTLTGFYVVRAEFEGCVSPLHPEVPYVETEVLPVPPEWLDLLLTLDCEAITPPELHLPTQVQAAATSMSGAIVSFDAAAHDGRDGDVPVTCAPASGARFALGTTLVSCSASDSSGNVARASFPVTVSFSWSDVLAPLRAAGPNRVRSGRTVPVRFRLTGASARIKDAVARLYVAAIVNGSPGPETPARSKRRRDSHFRYEAHEREYEFEWSTTGLPVGRYQLRIDLGDGISHTVPVELRPRHRDDDDDDHDRDHHRD
jgi:hypothetical protein